jgi:hypothetical protein
MKNSFIVILFILFALLTSNTFGQKYINILEPPQDLPIKNGIVTYQGVIDVEGATLAELYGFAKKFIAENYKSTDAPIDMDDTLNRVIVVKGRSDIPLIWYENKPHKVEKMMTSVSVNHVLIFELKANRLRFTFKDLVSAEKTVTSLGYSYTYPQVSIETHLEKRKLFDQIENPKNKEMASANYSGAFLVGCHEYFKRFSSQIEPYIKSQKAEDW